MKYLIAIKTNYSYSDYEVVEAKSEKQAIILHSKFNNEVAIMAKYDNKTIIIVDAAVDLNKLKLLNKNIKIK